MLERVVEVQLTDVARARGPTVDEILAGAYRGEHAWICPAAAWQRRGSVVGGRVDGHRRRGQRAANASVKRAVASKVRHAVVQLRP